MDKYVKILKENNLKVTPQRLTIMKYLDKHNTHPTAFEIYFELKKLNPSLSKTTVYNSLETLIEHNVIQTIYISGLEHRYEFRDDFHHHFLCKNCGKIADIDMKCTNIEKVRKMGYNIEEIHGYFKGICKECAEKIKSERGGENN